MREALRGNRGTYKASRDPGEGGGTEGQALEATGRGPTSFAVLPKS